MSIATEITRLQNDSAAIAAAIAAKGVTVPSGSGFDDYATLIGQISGGGSDPDAWLKDGDTHLWLDISTDYQLDQRLRLRMIGTIDWGDGTVESVSVTTYSNFTHTYAAKGKYRIDLKPSSGTFYLGGNSNNYCVLGPTSDRGNVINALYQAEIGTKRMTTLQAYAFYYCRGLVRAYIPKTITTIGAYSFGYCYGIRSIEFEDSSKVTTLGQNTFYYAYVLIDLSKFTPEVDTFNSLFRYCSCVPEIILPATLTTLSGYALGNMASLKKLKCLPASAPSAGSNVFTSFPSTCQIVVPFGSLSSYQAAANWADYSSQMVEAGAITKTLSHATSSNGEVMATANEAYTTTITADEGYTLSSVTVTMGGVDITSTAYSNGVVSIASVTGNITITATTTANS